MATRRQFIFALGTSALAAPIACLAQQTKVWQIGMLNSGAPSPWARAFEKRMGELGYSEGRNVRYERRYANGKFATLPGFATELVRLKVDVIIASATPAISAAQQATRTIPIVMTTAVDPVGSGLVNSLAHPGENITGMSNLGGDFTPKLLELASAAIPGLSRVAVLANPEGPATKSMLSGLRTAAQQLRIKLLEVEAKTAIDIAGAFARAKRERVGAIVVMVDSLFVTERRAVTHAAVKAKLPAIYGVSELAEDGGLMSYGPPLSEQYVRAAAFVDKILRGAKPADLPVEQVTKLELVINLKTAKAIGFNIPRELLLRADRVIE